MAAQSAAWRGPWAGPWPGARRALARAWAGVAPGPAAAGRPLAGGAGWIVEGEVALCPATGAVLLEGREVAGAARAAGPVDRATLRWGSVAREAAGIAPVGFDAAGGAGALLAALAALDRLGVPADWAAVVPARFGAAFEVQEALAAGACAPRPVRVAGWDRALRAPRAALLAPGAVGPEDRAEGAARLARALATEAGRRAAPRLARALRDAASGAGAGPVNSGKSL